MTVTYPVVSAVPQGTSAVATLSGDMRRRKLVGVVVNGPVGSKVNVYLGFMAPSSRIDSTSRGQSNTADYATGRDIPAGVSVSVEWPGQAGKADQCSATFHVDG